MLSLLFDMASLIAESESSFSKRSSVELAPEEVTAFSLPLKIFLHNDPPVAAVILFYFRRVGSKHSLSLFRATLRSPVQEHGKTTDKR